MSVENHPIQPGHVIVYRSHYMAPESRDLLFRLLVAEGLNPRSAGGHPSFITVPRDQNERVIELQRTNPARFGNPPTDETQYFVRNWRDGGLPEVIDRAVKRSDGLLIGSMDPTVTEMSIDQNTTIVMSSSRLLELTRSAARTDPEEISEADFHAALGALPPHRSWGTGFAMSEFYTADITWIYQREDGRYFKFRDQESIASGQASLRVRESNAFLHPAVDEDHVDAPRP